MRGRAARRSHGCHSSSGATPLLHPKGWHRPPRARAHCRPAAAPPQTYVQYFHLSRVPGDFFWALASVTICAGNLLVSKAAAVAAAEAAGQPEVRAPGQHPACGLPAAVMHLGAARALARPAVGRWLVVFTSTSTTAGVGSAHPPCRRPRASRPGSLAPALAACWWQRPSRSAAPPTCTSALAGWWWPSCCASSHWALRCSRWWRCCRA